MCYQLLDQGGISILEYPREWTRDAVVTLSPEETIRFKNNGRRLFRDTAIRLFTVKLLGFRGNHCDPRVSWPPLLDYRALCKMLRRKWSLRSMQMRASTIFSLSSFLFFLTGKGTGRIFRLLVQFLDRNYRNYRVCIYSRSGTTFE